MNLTDYQDSQSSDQACPASWDLSTVGARVRNLLLAYFHSCKLAAHAFRQILGETSRQTTALLNPLWLLHVCAGSTCSPNFLRLRTFCESRTVVGPSSFLFLLTSCYW